MPVQATLLITYSDARCNLRPRSTSLCRDDFLGSSARARTLSLVSLLLFSAGEEYSTWTCIDHSRDWVFGERSWFTAFCWYMVLLFVTLWWEDIEVERRRVSLRVWMIEYRR